MKEKLVRDNIPEIIKSSGGAPEFRIASDEEFVTLIRAKLQEEVQELLEAKKKEDILEELCDVLEVLSAISASTGLDTTELFERAKIKRNANGAFNSKYVLKLEEK